MHHHDETDVLVVGAGPVGLLTALLLSKNGIRVKIIDKEKRTTTHSYACTLHPRSLEILQRAGLLDQVLELGQRVDTVAFYEGAHRCGEMRLSQLPLVFPFALVLPQSSLEALLEQALADGGRVRVNWNHRLSRLELEPAATVAAIEELHETAKGYSVPTWDWVAGRTVDTRAAFVIGADGRDSHVRQLLGIEHDYAGDPEVFVIYEFESERKFDNEAWIVFDQTTTNFFWPLGGGRGRWSFQAVGNWLFNESPTKERSVFRIVQPAVERATQQDLHRLIEKLAPWFRQEILDVYWSAEADFRPCLVKRFGQGRCWLAGDAAHQAGPAGVQSMNLGLAEANELAETITGILRNKASLNLLESYNKKYRAEWERLLGIKPPLKPSAQADPWVRRRASDILRCVPASGDALTCLLNQVGLGFQTNP